MNTIHAKLISKDGFTSINNSNSLIQLKKTVDHFLTSIERTDLIGLIYDNAALSIEDKDFADILWRAVEKFDELTEKETFNY